MSKLNEKDKLTADRIYSIRRHLGLSQSEIALILDVKSQYISALENGRRKPGSRTLYKLIALCIENDVAVDATFLRPDYI